MLMETYSIHDSKSKTFSPPFFQRSRGEAIRAFSELANKQDNNIGKYPEDFCLYQVGTFEDNTGEIQAVKLVNVGLASQFVVDSTN